MSVQAMGWVFDHSPTEGRHRLVLLALANHAGRSPVDGAWECWPGLATIQREANIGRARTAQQVLADLEGMGAIVRVINGAPDARLRGDRRPNLYRIMLNHGVAVSCTPSEGIESVDNGANSRERGGGFKDDGVAVSAPRGGTRVPPEPSLEPNYEPSSSSARGDDGDRDAPSDDDGGEKVEEALAIMAAASLAERVAKRGEVGDRDAWQREATRRLRQQFAHRALGIVAERPEVTARQLAAMLDKVDGRTANPREGTVRAAMALAEENDRRLADELAIVPTPEAAERGLATARAALHR